MKEVQNMIGMTLELTTEYIQYLMIALTFAEVNKSCIIPKGTIDEMQDVLAELNSMCTEKNGYRLSVEVSAE